ncbi:hypothetical protein RSAG8_07421, partial [Rhizoctonia solani AG-8 WAC10335]
MRSNIVKFCSQDVYPPLDELLSHARNLQTLYPKQTKTRHHYIFVGTRGTCELVKLI